MRTNLPLHTSLTCMYNIVQVLNNVCHRRKTNVRIVNMTKQSEALNIDRRAWFAARRTLKTELIVDHDFKVSIKML